MKKILKGSSSKFVINLFKSLGIVFTLGTTSSCSDKMVNKLNRGNEKMLPSNPQSVGEEISYSDYSSNVSKYSSEDDDKNSEQSKIETSNEEMSDHESDSKRVTTSFVNNLQELCESFYGKNDADEEQKKIVTRLVKLWLSPSLDFHSIQGIFDPSKEIFDSSFLRGFKKELKEDLDKIDKIFETTNKMSNSENKIRSKAYSDIFSELDKNYSRLEKMYSFIFENIKKNLQGDVNSEELEKLKEFEIFLSETICYIKSSLDITVYEDIDKRLNKRGKHINISSNAGLCFEGFEEHAKYLLNLHNFFLDIKSNLESKLTNVNYEITEESFKEYDNALILLNFIYKFQKKELGKIISGKSERDKLLFKLVFCREFCGRYVTLWNKIEDILKECVKNNSTEKPNFAKKLLKNYYFYSAGFNPIQYDLDSEINDICKKRVENLYHEYEEKDFSDRKIQFEFLKEFKEQLFWLNEEFQIARKRYFCALEYMCKYKKNEKFFYSLGIDMFREQMDFYNEVYKECEDFFEKMTKKIPSCTKKKFDITPEKQLYFFKSRIKDIVENKNSKGENDKGYWIIYPFNQNDSSGENVFRNFLDEQCKLINSLENENLSGEFCFKFNESLKSLIKMFISAKKKFNNDIKNITEVHNLNEITEHFHPLYVYESQKFFIESFLMLWIEIEDVLLQRKENVFDEDDTINRLFDIYKFFSVFLYDFQCDIEHEETSFFEDFYRSYFENYKL